MHTALAVALALTAFQDTEPAIGADVWRHELGRRLAAMEQAFGAANEELRVAALPQVERAVTAFFSGGLDRASEAIDAARRVLVPLPIEDPAARAVVEAQRAFGDRLALVPQTRLVALGTASLTFDVLDLYGDGTVPAGLSLHVGVRPSGGGAGPQTHFASPLAFPCRATLELEGLAAGDHTLDLIVFERDLPLRRVPVAFAVADDLDARLLKLSEAVGTRSEVERSVPAFTAHHLLGLLDDLARKETPETDLHANALLTEAETLAFGDDAARAALLASPGDRYVALPLAKGTSIGRLFVPHGITLGSDVPIVVALHGAGGTENLFFEAYGDGLAMRLARDRRWILFAPRVGMFGYPLAESLDALDTFLPIDRTRVFVVGHSMGAAATVGAVAKSPTSVRAYAALGGGGRATAAMKDIPGFVAAGASDFGKRGADALAAQLREFGALTLEARTYADTEHLLIVQRALPDVFAFFDAHARASDEASEPPVAGSGD